MDKRFYIPFIVIVFILIIKEVFKQDYSYNSTSKLENIILYNKELNIVDSISVGNCLIKDSHKIKTLLLSLNKSQKIDLNGIRLSVRKRWHLKIYKEGEAIPGFNIIRTDNYGDVVVLWGPSYLGMHRLKGYYKCDGIGDYLISICSD